MTIVSLFDFYNKNFSVDGFRFSQKMDTELRSICHELAIDPYLPIYATYRKINQIREELLEYARSIPDHVSALFCGFCSPTLQEKKTIQSLCELLEEKEDWLINAASIPKGEVLLMEVGHALLKSRAPTDSDEFRSLLARCDDRVDVAALAIRELVKDLLQWNPGNIDNVETSDLVIAYLISEEAHLMCNTSDEVLSSVKLIANFFIRCYCVDFFNQKHNKMLSELKVFVRLQASPLKQNNCYITKKIQAVFRAKIAIESKKELIETMAIYILSVSRAKPARKKFLCELFIWLQKNFYSQLDRDSQMILLRGKGIPSKDLLQNSYELFLAQHTTLSSKERKFWAIMNTLVSTLDVSPVKHCKSRKKIYPGSVIEEGVGKALSDQRTQN